MHRNFVKAIRDSILDYMRSHAKTNLERCLDNDKYSNVMTITRTELRSLIDQIDVKQKEIVVLKIALEPFAKAARRLDDDTPPGLRCESSMSIEGALYEEDQPTVGDLRMARKLCEGS